MSNSTTSAERKIYYHGHRRLFLLCATFLFAIVLQQLIAGQTTLLLGLHIYLTAWMFAIGCILRIETSASGISYHNMGLYTIRTSWDNVAGIRSVPMRFFGDTRCIVLHEPAAQGLTWLAFLLPSAERGRIIPLPIGTWAHIAELEDDLRRYTGHEIT